MPNLPNPYVGPRAYESNETLYGRDHEIRQLMALLVAERIVLLYSPSGAGKTSLLQAGLIPRMRADDFNVLPVVRVNLEPPNRLAGAAANRYLLSTLLSLEEELPKELRLNPSDLLGLSLDAYLGRRCRPEGAAPSDLLVFDQFEEVLTVSPSDREGKLAFFEQLGAALRNRSRWAIFAMREDYVAALAPYLRPVPTQLSTGFRLDLLGCAAAKQAVQKPAQGAGVDFTAEAAEKLVSDLSLVQEQAPDGSIESKPGLYVEPVQLQVVCYRLWEAHAAGDQANTPADRAITTADLGQVGSVDDSLAAYYAESAARVAAAAGIEERAIREWFGTRLITPEGVRSQVLQRADASDGLDNRAIFQLVDTHILRAEKRAGATWFELAHDRMIAPVRQSNTAWFAANLRLFQVQAGLWDQHGRGEGLLLRGKALAAAEGEAKTVRVTPVEQEFLEACKKVREREAREKRRNRVMTILAVAATIAMIAAVVLALWALDSQRTAESALTTAQSERMRADQQAKAALLRQLNAQSQSFPESLSENYQLKGLLAVQAYRLNQQLQDRQELNSFLSLENFLLIPGRLIAGMKHDDGVAAAAFSPDGRWVASGDWGGKIKVWETATGNLIAEMQHDTAVRALAFSPDGLWLAAGDNGLFARVWEAATGKLVAELQHDETVVWNVTFSPDGKWVITRPADMRVWVWEAATGRLLAKIEHDGYYDSDALSANMRRLVTWNRDGTVQVWDTETGAPIAKLPSEGNVEQAVFSPDGSRVAGRAGNNLFIWNADTGEKLVQMQHENYVRSVAFSPDGQYVISASDDLTARVWEAATGNPVAKMQHGDYVTSAAFSPNGLRVVTQTWDNAVRVWDAQTGARLSVMPHDREVNRVIFSADSQWVITDTADYAIRVWSAATGEEAARMQHEDYIYSIDTRPAPGGNGLWVVSGSGDGAAWVWEAAAAQPSELQKRADIYAAALGPDGRLVVTASYEGGIEVWDAAAGALLRQMPDSKGAPVLDISPDGRLAAPGYYDDKKAQLWDVDTGAKLSEMPHDCGVTSIAFSGDGQRLVTGCDVGTVRVWEAMAATQVWETQHGGSISAVAFSPDGRWVASGGENNTVRVWNAGDGSPVSEMSHPDWVVAVAFSADGEWVYSGDLGGSAKGGVVKKWKADTGELAWERQLDKTATTYAFSPDGRWVATGNGTGAVRVWEAESGREVAKMQFGKKIQTLSFSADSRKLAAVVDTDPLRIASFLPEDFAGQICSRLNRDLTESEWQQYIGGTLSYEKTCTDLPAGGE